MVLALLAVSTVLPTVAAGQQSVSTGTQSDVDLGTVVLQVRIQSDDTALWRIEHRIRLDDQNTTAAFESLRRNIETNTTVYRDRFAERMRRTVVDAETKPVMRWPWGTSP